MAAIELQDIHKRFGAGAKQTHTLRGIDLHMGDGEFVVYVGPSGCGKSTLLRLIAGLESTSSGRVLIGGRDLTHAAPSQRQVAMVFQSYALYPHMTVRDNLGFGMRMRGVPAAIISAKLERAAAMLQLGPYLERRPAELSGGQCQRVAIGRAIVQEPGVFLFDEPLSNLDAELRLRMRLEIAALHRELGRTMVYVTHDQVEAMSMADRICVLDRGRVQQVGVPDEVYNRPVNTFVATTVGMPPMNLLPVRVEAVNGNVHLRSSTFSLEAPIDSRMELIASQTGQELHIGVRPEDVRIGADAPAAAMRCRVIAVEPLGGEVIVDLDLNGRIVKAMTPPDVHIEPDELIPVEFDLSRIHVFGTDGRSVYAADGASAFATVA